MKRFMFVSQFLRDMKSQKLRTVLTIFGIIWGTLSIIILLAFGIIMLVLAKLAARKGKSAQA